MIIIPDNKELQRKTRTYTLNLTPVEKHIFAAFGVPTDTKEDFRLGIQREFSAEFCAQDYSVAGMDMESKVQGYFFPYGQRQRYIPTANEWIDGLVLFAAKAAKEIAKACPFTEDHQEIENFFGQTTSRLLGLAKPGTEVFVTPSAGISKGGKVLGTSALRTQFLIKYGETLDKINPIPIPMEEGVLIDLMDYAPTHIDLAQAAD